MNTATLGKPAFRINWLYIKDRARMFGIVAISFAAGGWAVSIRDQSASLPYKNRSTAELQSIHKEVGANPVAQIHCLTNKSNVAEQAALQATVSTFSDSVPLPDLSAIPSCPKPKPAKPSASVPK
jgi:hypothetical protein